MFPNKMASFWKMPRRVVRFDPYANRYAIFFREISRSYGFSQPNPKKNCFGLLGEKSSKTHKKKREIRPRRLTNQCRPSFKGEGLKKKTGHSRILRDPFQSSLTPNAFWKQNIDIPAPCDCANNTRGTVTLVSKVPRYSKHQSPNPRACPCRVREVFTSHIGS